MSSFSRTLAICISVMLLLTLASPSSAQGLRIWGLAQLTSAPSGEFGDNILGPGGGVAGEMFYAINPNIYMGGGLRIDIHSGRDIEGTSIERTEGGASVGIDVGGLVTLPVSETVRPFMGLSLGRAGIAWGYGDAMSMDSDSDGVGFFYAAFRGGMIFDVGSSLGLVTGVRFVVASDDDETSEGYIWDVDGGNFIQGFFGLEIRI